MQLDGQRPTCRRCNRPGHFAYDCTNHLCFNCEQVGHEPPQCPSPLKCNICKEVGHLVHTCIFSWLRGEPVHPVATDEARAVDVEGLVSPPHQMETPVIPQTISPSPSLPVPPIQPEETMEQNEPEEPTTKSDNIFDSKMFLRVLPLTSFPDPLEQLTTQNRFDVLTEDKTDEVEDKTTEQTNV